MDFLAQPLNLYQQMTKDLEKVFVSVYPKPGGRGSAFLFQEGHPDEVWPLVDTALRHAANSFSNFNIRIGRGTKNDPTPLNIPVSVYSPQNANRTAGIAGTGYNGLPGPDIGAIESRLEAKYKEKLDDALEKNKMTARIDGLEYELKAKRRRSADNWEKFENFCETTGLDLSNPDSIRAINGLLSGTINQLVSTAVGIFAKGGNMPSLAGPTTKIIEKPGTEKIPGDPELETNEEESKIDFNRPIRSELSYQGVTEPDILTIDYNPAIESLMILKNAGAGNPGELLKKVALFYESNPEQALNLIENFLK